jgi:murein DD-endopeptidase MepM/ murein hydrolase activator NlpD
MLRVIAVLVLAVGLLWFAAPPLLGWSPILSAAWWATNTTPPTVTLSAPDHPVRGTAHIQVQAAEPTRADVVVAKLDDTSLTPGWTLDVDTTAVADGDHRVWVLVRDHTLHKNETRIQVPLRSDNTAPDLQLELSPAAPTEGHALVVRIRTEAAATVRADLNGDALAVQPGDTFHWAITGFSPDPPSTTVTIHVEATDAAGNVATLAQDYDLLRTKYPLENVQLPASMEAILDPQVRAQEDAALVPYHATASGPPRWDGLFLKPVQGEVTTIFGIERTYNSHTYVVHHGGTDFAAAIGDDVHVANNGVVVYVGLQPLRGNVLIIDHGAGVYSTYAHLSKILVQPGQEVRKGQVVAAVGSTGLSTGPHMHWEVWAGGANVDPIDWTEREMP